MARAAMLVMAVLSMAWVASAWHDMALQGSLSWRYTGVMLSVVLWGCVLYQRWCQPKQSAPMALHWFATAQPQTAVRCSLRDASQAIGGSHWRTLDDQPVALVVKVDLGTHLLLRIAVSNAVTYHWVRDLAVQGPWRWRITAHSPAVAHNQLSKRAVNRTRRKDAWHHRQP
jgi:hypothetical protein